VIRLHVAALRAALLVVFVSTSALAQERLDLSGPWRLKPSGGEGGVGLAGRVVGAEHDTYSMVVTLPDGGTRTLEAKFDGSTLTTRLPVRPMNDQVGTETPPVGPSVGLAAVVEDTDGTGAPSVESVPGNPGTDETRRPTPRPSPVRDGVYRLSRAAGGRTPAYRFDAVTPVDPRYATPVARFGRVVLDVQLGGPASLTTPATATILAKLVPAGTTGTFTWTAEPADAVSFAPSGASVVVTGLRAADVTLTCKAEAMGQTAEKTHALKVEVGVQTVEVVGVTYVSDHGLLREYDADWGVGGAVPSEPEWTAEKQGALSHTMGQKVKVRLQLRCGPEGAAATRVTLAGDGPVDFSQEVELTAGEMSLDLESSAVLESKVQKLEFGVTWSAGALTVQPASTTNTMYVTVDTPHAQGNSPGFTTKRMAKAVELVAGTNSLEPHSIVRPIISRYNNYNLRVAYHNAWELAEDAKEADGELVGADCQTIVRFTRDVIQQVGVQGTADFVVVYASCKDPATGLESLNARNHMTSPRQYHNSEFPEAADPARAGWFAALVDGSGGLNNYEACLRFEHGGRKSYYPGGVRAVFSEVQQVIGVFTTMSWVASDGSGELKVHEPHIHRYR